MYIHLVSARTYYFDQYFLGEVQTRQFDSISVNEVKILCQSLGTSGKKQNITKLDPAGFFTQCTLLLQPPSYMAFAHGSLMISSVTFLGGQKEPPFFN